MDEWNISEECLKLFDSGGSSVPRDIAIIEQLPTN